MKWKAKPLPKNGDERWTLQFAFVPCRCNDGYVRWLCDLYVRQIYQIYGECAGDSWVNIEYSRSYPCLSQRHSGGSYGTSTRRNERGGRHMTAPEEHKQ
jgi:hypothetical protein